MFLTKAELKSGKGKAKKEPFDSTKQKNLLYMIRVLQVCTVHTQPRILSNPLTVT